MISALLYAAGAAQTPAALTYDVSFVLTQGAFTGVTTFAVDRAGAVTGTLKLTDPQMVDATLGGTVKDGTWTFEYGFAMPERGCSGTVTGKGTVAKDMATVKGRRHHRRRVHRGAGAGDVHVHAQSEQVNQPNGY